MSALAPGVPVRVDGATGLDAAIGAVRRARSSGRRRRRLVVGGLGLLVLGLLAAYVLLGSYTVTVGDLLRIVGGAQIPGATFIVRENKLPQALVGLGVGGAFGVAGAVFQTLLRNPLASPDVIGITAGASTAAVLAIVLGGAGGLVLSGASLLGALVVAVGIWSLARHHGVAGQRLVLVGIGVAAVLQSCVSYLLTRTDITVASQALVWLSGSLNEATWQRAVVLLVGLALLLPLTALAVRQLSALELGDDAATGLGVRSEPARLALVLLAVTLAALATAAAGPVSFVAFLSGPIARRLLGGRWSLMGSALVGAAVVLAAAYLASNVVPGHPLPVGVVTGVLGGPCLVWLLVAANRTGQGG